MNLSMCPDSSSYDPSSLVTAFHNIPHRDINLNPTPDTFMLSLSYFQAIIIWACVPILIVVCLFILMSVYFICVCCCCCCQQHDKRSKCSKATCGVLVELLILLALACCGVAMWSSFTVDTSINNSINSATNVNNVIQGVRSSVQMLDFNQTEMQVNNLSMAIKESNGTGQSQAVIAVMQLQEELTPLRIQFARIQNEANVQDLSPAISSIRGIEVIRHWTIVGYIILTILILFLMALSVCFGACCKNPVCMVLALILLGFFTLTMWIAVGGKLAYLIISADICNDPDGLITNLTASELPVNTVRYYLVCNETCYNNPFAASQDSVNASLEHVVDFQNTISEYIYNNSLVNLQPQLDVVVQSINGSISAITSISMQTNCRVVNSAYLGVLEGLCQTGYVHSIVLFAMACVIALLLIFTMICGSFYAGLLSKGRTFDDETIVYDFPNENGPSPWESYGTSQQRYHNTTTTQARYNYRDSMTLTGASEPPKYSDLNTQETPIDIQPNGARTSGAYDNLS